MVERPTATGPSPLSGASDVSGGDGRAQEDEAQCPLGGVGDELVTDATERALRLILLGAAIAA